MYKFVLMSLIFVILVGLGVLFVLWKELVVVFILGYFVVCVVIVFVFVFLGFFVGKWLGMYLVEFGIVMVCYSGLGGIGDVVIFFVLNCMGLMLFV